MCASVVLPALCLISSQEVPVWLVQHACLGGESAASEQVTEMFVKMSRKSFALKDTLLWSTYWHLKGTP